MVRAFRDRDDDTPIVLMGYYNPIYSYGNARFLDDAKAAGVDGLIVVDLPPEADDELCLPALAAGLNFIRLATPTTDDRRLPAVLENTSGFVYYVSITGITGAALAGHRQGRGGGAKDQAAHHIAGRRRLRRQDRRAGARHRARGRRRRGRLGAGRARSSDSLDRDGRATADRTVARRQRASSPSSRRGVREAPAPMAATSRRKDYG